MTKEEKEGKGYNNNINYYFILFLFWVVTEETKESKMAHFGSPKGITEFSSIEGVWLYAIGYT